MTRRLRSPMLRRNERGVVLVEFAFVMMFLVTMVFGIVEFGLAWQDRMTLQTATRSAVRVGSNLATNAEADYNILLAVNAALQDVGPDNIEHVVIYKSTTANGKVPTACVSPFVTGVALTCNAYTGAQLANLSSSQFGCGIGDLDLLWCPTLRQNILGSSPDYLGVWVRVSHDLVTNMFDQPVKLTDFAVMRLEPLG